MSAKVFFDTTILIYALTQNDPRSAKAEELLLTGGTISVQVLNEYIAVARRELRMNWKQISKSLSDIRILCSTPLSLTVATHETALAIAIRYDYQIYDSLVLASALEGNCTTLFSEDMQHGQRIGPLTIRNPFLGE
jgi:predicted nucleic acid-binding protein